MRWAPVYHHDDSVVGELREDVQRFIESAVNVVGKTFLVDVEKEMRLLLIVVVRRALLPAVIAAW